MQGAKQINFYNFVAHWNSMNIFHSINNIPFPQVVATMGTFDGVHTGHLSVFNNLRKRADELHAECLVITFWPHPRMLLNPEIGIHLINTLEERIELFEKARVRNLLVLEFTKEIAQLSAEQFIKKYLVDGLKIKSLIVGHDHMFGKGKSGNYETFIKSGSEYGFEVIRVDALSDNEGNISSTAIRKALSSGNIEKANRLLDYRYFLSGKVISGYKVGRKIGFPTANIEVSESYKLLPGIGVYAVKVRIGNSMHNGMLNIGYRPTIDSGNKKLSVEVHILDFEENIYKSIIRVEFIQKIRDEMHFPNIESLIIQLQRDKLTTRAIFEKGV